MKKKLFIMMMVGIISFSSMSGHLAMAKGDDVSITTSYDDESEYESDDEYSLKPYEEKFQSGKVKGVNISLYNNLKKVKVYWDYYSYAEEYRIEYSTQSDFKKKKTIVINDSDIESKVIKIKSNTTYYIRIRALFRNVYSKYSTVIKFKSDKKTLKECEKQQIYKCLKKKKGGYFQIVDLNGDGLAELLYGNKKKQLKGVYYYNNGKMVNLLYTFHLKKGAVNVKKKTISYCLKNVDGYGVDYIYRVVKIKKSYDEKWLKNFSVGTDNVGNYYYYCGNKKITKQQFEKLKTKISMKNVWNPKKNNKSNRNKISL